MITKKPWNTYQEARNYYRSHGAVVSTRRPLSLRSRMLAGAGLAAILAATLFLPATAAIASQPQMYLGAAGAWTFYNEAKKYLMQGDIDLNSSTFRMGLYTSASNAATATLSRHDQVTNECSEANGYSSSGKALAAVTWTAGASASEMRFDATANIWTALGGNIANVKFAVLFIEGASAGARKLVAYSQLSTSQFTITTGNTLTVTPSANGLFELN
jgi:hypothetical protein